MKKGEAIIAFMCKMLIVAYRLLRTEELYDPTNMSYPEIFRGDETSTCLEYT